MQVDPQFETAFEFFEHYVSIVIDSLKHILPHFENHFMLLTISRQHTNLLVVTPTPRLPYIFLLNPIQRLQNVRAEEHYELVVHALGEVREVLRQLVPALFS